MKTLAPILWLAATLLAAPAARAQMSPDLIMETYNSNMSAITSGVINSANLNNILDGSARPNSKRGIVVGRPGPAGERDGGAAVAARPAMVAGSGASAGTRLAYVPTPALRQQTVQGYVSRLQAKNPAAAQAVAANFGPGKHDYGTIYAGIVRPYGIRLNEATDAVVANIVLGYLIVRNQQGNGQVSAAQMQGLRAQLGSRLAGNARLAAPGAAAQLGEEMKLQFVVLQSGWQSAIRENKLPAYQQGIAALFRQQWGLDFSQLALTPQGLARK